MTLQRVLIWVMGNMISGVVAILLYEWLTKDYCP